jgi:predicted dehydrogenase
MGYDDSKVIEAAKFLRSVTSGNPYGPTLDDALRSAEALEAMVESATTGSWVRL